jgi:hypothetical protein
VIGVEGALAAGFSVVGEVVVRAAVGVEVEGEEVGFLVGAALVEAVEAGTPLAGIYSLILIRY